MVPLPIAMWMGEHEGVLRARLAGRFEAPWAEEVRRDLLRHRPAAVQLDLAGLTAIDARGVATLVAVRQDVVSGGGRFVLHGVSDAVRAAFAAAELDMLVDDEPEHQVAASRALPVTHLALKGGRSERLSAATTPMVA